MKRSKIFLGLTTAILAVVGVAAAKRFNGTVRYYLTSAEAYCKASPAELCKFVSGGSFICHTTVSGTSVQLFTKGPAGVVGATNKCSTLLSYNESGE